MILWIPRWTKELIATKLEEKWNFCCWNNTELAAKKKQQEWSWFWWMWNEKCYNLAWRSMHWRKTWWRNKCVTERELRLVALETSVWITGREKLSQRVFRGPFFSLSLLIFLFLWEHMLYTMFNAIITFTCEFSFLWQLLNIFMILLNKF